MARNLDFGSFASFMSGVSDFTGETIFNALGHYFMQPELWSCPEEGFVLLQLLTVGGMSGHNNFKDAFDPVGNFEVLDKIFYSVFGGSSSVVPDPAPSEEAVMLDGAMTSCSGCPYLSENGCSIADQDTFEYECPEYNDPEPPYVPAEPLEVF